MATKLMSKQQTQQVIRDLRKAGYTLDKRAHGSYHVILNDEEIFTALPGSRGYLVSFHSGLLTPA